MFAVQARGMKHCFLALDQGPEGIRELLEACRNHFHPPWYLTDTVAPSYGQNPGGLPSTIYFQRDFMRNTCEMLEISKIPKHPKTLLSPTTLAFELD